MLVLCLLLLLFVLEDHFPDAYAGTNTKIRDTLNNLILKSPQSWQTSVGLPFFQIQGTVRARPVMMTRAFVC